VYDDNDEDDDDDDDDDDDGVDDVDTDDACVQLTLIILDNDNPPVWSDPRFIFVVVNDPDFDRCGVCSLQQISTFSYSLLLVLEL